MTATSLRSADRPMTPYRSAVPSPDAPVRSPEITMGRSMAARPDALFRASTQPFDRRFAVPGTIRGEGRVGAGFCVETELDGARHPQPGRFPRLETNALVELSWVTAATGGADTIVTGDLADAGNGTRLRLTHRGFLAPESAARPAEAWPRMLAHLDVAPHSSSPAIRPGFA